MQPTFIYNAIISCIHIKGEVESHIALPVKLHRHLASGRIWTCSYSRNSQLPPQGRLIGFYLHPSYNSAMTFNLSASKHLIIPSVNSRITAECSSCIGCICFKHNSGCSSSWNCVSSVYLAGGIISL